MNTFDLLLFKNGFSFFTPTSWDHVGLILKDPSWLHPHLEGTYVLETCASGVRLTPFTDRVQSAKGRIYMRRAILQGKLNTTALKDTIDRLIPESFNTLSSFFETGKTEYINWSSDLVAYIMTRMKFLNFYGIKGTVLTPNDFVPKGKIDNYVLPGLHYSDDLVKVR